MLPREHLDFFESGSQACFRGMKITELALIAGQIVVEHSLVFERWRPGQKFFLRLRGSFEFMAGKRLR